MGLGILIDIISTFRRHGKQAPYLYRIVTAGMSDLFAVGLICALTVADVALARMLAYGALLLWLYHRQGQVAAPVRLTGE